MASNPQIEAIPPSIADPHSSILKFIQAQTEFQPIYYSEGKQLWDEYLEEYAVSQAAEKAQAEEERRAQHQRDKQNASSSQRTGTSGNSSAGPSRKAGGIKNKMRDRFGNLPDENETSRESKGINTKRDRKLDRGIQDVDQDVDMDKENLPNPPTPKLKTKREIEAQIRSQAQAQAQTREILPLPFPFDLHTSPFPKVRSKALAPSNKQHCPQIDSKYTAQKSTEVRGGGGKKRETAEDDRGCAEVGHDGKRDGKKVKLDEIDGLVGGKQRNKEKNRRDVEVDGSSEERDARLEARKLKRRAKASVLHPRSLGPPPLDRSELIVKPTAARVKGRKVQGHAPPESEEGEEGEEEEEERSLIEVNVHSPTKPNRTKPRKVIAMPGHVAAQAKSVPKAKGSKAMEREKEKAEVGKAGAKVGMGRKVGVLAMLNAEGGGGSGAGERPGGRITLGPRRGVFAKGIASTNLPVRSTTRGKVPPVPDLAFCENTFLSRPTRKVPVKKKSKTPPPVEEAPTSEEEVESEDQEMDSEIERDNKSEAESSELSSVPSSGREVKAGKPNERQASAGSSLTSELSSPRMKTRETMKAQPIRKANRADAASDGEPVFCAKRDKAFESTKHAAKEAENSRGRASSPDWPSSLPDEDDAGMDRKDNRATVPLRDVPKRTAFGKGRLSLLPPTSESAIGPSRARAFRGPNGVAPCEAQKPDQLAIGASASAPNQIEAHVGAGDDSLMDIIQDAIFPNMHDGQAGFGASSSGSEEEEETRLIHPENGRVRMLEAMDKNENQHTDAYGGQQDRSEPGVLTHPWHNEPGVLDGTREGDIEHQQEVYLASHHEGLFLGEMQQSEQYPAQEEHGSRYQGHIVRLEEDMAQQRRAMHGLASAGNHHLDPGPPAPEWEDSDLEHSTPGLTNSHDEGGVGATHEHVMVDDVMIDDGYETGVGYVGHGEEALDMFGTTEAEAKRLLSNMRRIV